MEGDRDARGHIAVAGHVVAVADRGLEPQRSWVWDGVLDELEERVRWSRENRCLFEQRADFSLPRREGSCQAGRVI
ncbi:hypothetical protein NLX83_34605 [Allokutzneria sp. A3M-2-11 16]|uniref:hypothetical protein n=1 Tax=Allokutzneria sp. A3M-2-11 16 TaxID=2962043 RepID=UPI0020B69EFC|nr:hypothetical protein [Allokutzneria sp. A3M-2-11 16]MCP3804412.1 hypothetical protein [Allokutzneria sp. A3M-2-11 16]